VGCAVDGRSTFRGLCNRQPAALWILMGWPYALFSRRLPSQVEPRSVRPAHALFTAPRHGGVARSLMRLDTAVAHDSFPPPQVRRGPAVAFVAGKARGRTCLPCLCWLWGTVGFRPYTDSGAPRRWP